MKDKRQGNDLKVAWSIFMQDGEPFRLDGKDVSLYLKNMFGRKELNDFATTGNIIQWTFYGKDQKNSGKYSLELVINEGEKGMITTDKCDFVNLVSCSCKLQGGEDAPNVETESIELTSTLEYVSGGGEYDDTALWKELENKVDKVEGLGLSEENYTTEDKEKLAGLENYDDSGIKEELANKAEKDEIPTKMSQLEQDIEIGGEVDLSDYPTREEVSETYLPREEFNEVSERFASADSVQELSENVTELSTEVSGLSEKVDELGNPVFKAVYGETTFEEIKAAYDSGKVVHCDYNSLCYVLSRITANGAYFAAVNDPYAYRMDCTSSSQWTNRVIELEVTSNKVTSLSDKSTDTQYPSAKAVYEALQNVGGEKEWKCVYDGRLEVGQMQIESTTYADGTPLDAEELVVQVIMESSEGVTQPRQGYVEINSSLNKNKEQYGAIYFEKPSLTNPAISMIRLKASPFIMVADVLDAAPIAVAQGGNLLARAGRYGQIYENISYVRVYSTQAIQAMPPIIKIYAR